MVFLVMSPFTKYSGKERDHSCHKPLQIETSGGMYTLVIIADFVKKLKERNKYF